MAARSRSILSSTFVLHFRFRFRFRLRLRLRLHICKAWVARSGGGGGFGSIWIMAKRAESQKVYEQRRQCRQRVGSRLQSNWGGVAPRAARLFWLSIGRLSSFWPRGSFLPTVAPYAYFFFAREFPRENFQPLVWHNIYANINTLFKELMLAQAQGLNSLVGFILR